jgi:hypothetical protein
LYVGVALMVDRAARLGRDAYHRRRWIRLALAVLLAVAEIRLCADIVGLGTENLDIWHAYGNKHGLDDRAAVRWLMGQRQPGDAMVSTHLAWPAVWWYGDIAIGDEQTAAGRLPDGGAMFEARYVDPGAGCQPNQIRDVLKDHRRVLVYVGFRDVPAAGFDDLLLRSLEEIGAVSAYNEFADISRAAVIDLAPGSESRFRDTADARPGLAGCVELRPAVRW